MKTSKNGLDLIIQFEGIASKDRNKNVTCAQHDIENDILIYPYICSAGHKTIGVGCVIDNETKYDNGIKISESMNLFKTRLIEFESMINKWLDKSISIDQNQFDALVCFCFNIPKGAKAVCEMINENESMENIQNKWLSFCNVKGIPNKGILFRRRKEYNLFIL